ncbi:hypothetical protein D3C72_2570940 [compost metagenome]
MHPDGPQVIPLAERLEDGEADQAFTLAHDAHHRHLEVDVHLLPAALEGVREDGAIERHQGL